MICNSYDKCLLSLIHKEFLQKDKKKANNQKKNGQRLWTTGQRREIPNSQLTCENMFLH